jgi:protein-S-isoprenylcysteine O-methyltransferase Ste14
MELPIQYLYAVIGWVLWCTLHSVLISMTVMDYLKKRLGDGFRFYRVFYNTVAIATLIPLIHYSVSIRQELVFRWDGPLVIIQGLLLLTSISLFIAGGWGYSLSKLLGIHQIMENRLGRSLSGYDTFVVKGIHLIVRHPWYLAGILIVWAQDLYFSTILVNMVISAYFYIGSILEEQKLTEEFGDRYREYQRNVSMLFPYKWMKTMIIGALKL